MELMRVKYEDVYPDENNPRQDFSGIEELAESFKLNAARPGEPFAPPILVRDGQIFRIVDGERRYRAMGLLKAREFDANVCDDMDEADAMVAMLATDDKAPLSELERSRGVQRMLLLGVTPERVDRAARVKGSARVRRAMRVVDDAAEDMTLDRLLAIDEFADDPEAVADIMNAGERDWRWKASAARQRREREARRAAFAEEAARIGAPTVSGRADLPEGMRMAWSVKDVADLEDEFSRAGEGAVLLVDGAPGADVYVPGPTRTQGDPEAEGRAAELAKDAAAFDGSARAWFASTLMAGGIPEKRGLAARLRDRLWEEELSGFAAALEDYPELAGDALSRIDYAVAFATRPLLEPYIARSVATGSGTFADEAMDFLEFMTLLLQSGMPEDETARRLRVALEEYRDSGAEDE